MRICYIANTSNNVHFARWYRFFRDKGHEVHVASGDPSRVQNRIDIPGVRVHYLPEKKLPYHRLSVAYNLIKLPVIIRELNRIIDQISPDVIHAHQVYAEGFWGALTGFHPFIVTPIGSDLLVHAQESQVMRLISRYVLERADLVTGDSLILQQEIFRFGGVREKTHLILNGVDLRVFHPQVSGSRVRQKYGIGDQPVILSVRNLDEIYRVKEIIEAIPTVLEGLPNAKFIFCYVPNVGSPFDPHALVRALGLEQSVILVGMTPRNEIPEYYAAADLCISVPSSDSSPSSVYEAMACGTPVILSDLPWTKHFIKDEENALLISERSPRAIAKSILKILRDGALRQRLICNGLKTAHQYTDYHKNMRCMEDLMKIVCRSRTGGC